MIRGAAAAIGICAALAGCGAPDATTTIRFWAMGNEAEMIDGLIRGFEREHPEIRVAVQRLPWSSAHEKLLTAFVGETTPDLAQLGNTWVAELATLGALAPLDAELAGSPAVDPADYFAGIWDTNEVDGAHYGIPWYVDTRLLFYRKDVFAAAGVTELPVTWTGWRDSLRAIKATVGAGRYAILLPLDEFEQLLALTLQQDEPVLRAHGRYGNFRSAGFRRALAFYLEIFVEQLAPLAIQIQVPNPWEELARGYFASFFHGPWSIGEMKRRLPADQQGSWGTMALPGPHGPGAGVAGGSSLVVFRRATHPREAWQLIEYLARPDVQRQFNALTGNLPPRRASWDAELADDPHVRAFRDQLERVRRLPPVPEWERIATELRYVSERAARQVSPATTPAALAAIVDAAAADLDARVDRILEKRRWILDRRGAP